MRVKRFKSEFLNFEIETENPALMRVLVAFWYLRLVKLAKIWLAVNLTDGRRIIYRPFYLPLVKITKPSKG